VLVYCAPRYRADGSTFNLHIALHTNETGKHQDQVKALIEKTASSLDDTALKMLFVSVQQNNIELCIQYTISYLTVEIEHIDTEQLAKRTMLWFGHSFLRDYVNQVMMLTCDIRD